MKITKQQLKDVIKEEIQSTLNEDGTPPSRLHLPHDVGTPEKLLAGVEAILANPELASGRSTSQIDVHTAGQIINLINNKLMENPPEEIDDRLRDAKEVLQTMHGGRSSDRSQSYRDLDDLRIAQQVAREAARVTQAGTFGLEEGKITKQQLKELIKEELETVLNEKWDPKQAKELTMKARERERQSMPGTMQFGSDAQEKETDFAGTHVPSKYVDTGKKTQTPVIDPKSGGARITSLPGPRSGFEKSTGGMTGHKKTHGGMDIAAASGTDINYPFDLPGKVVSSRKSDSFGNVVDIETPQKQSTDVSKVDPDKLYTTVRDTGGMPQMKSTYAHMDKLSDLKKGDVVQQGGRIGGVGSTGHSSGDHLHYQVKDYGRGSTGPKDQSVAAAAQTDFYTPPTKPTASPPAVASATPQRRPRIRTDATVGDVIAAADAQKARSAATPSYKVKKGDTLSRIAKRQGTSVKDIMAANPNITDPNKIARGAKLNIPTGKRDDDEGIPTPGRNLAEAWGFDMDLGKLNEGTSGRITKTTPLPRKQPPKAPKDKAASTSRQWTSTVPQEREDEDSKELEEKKDEKFLQDVESTGEWTDYTITQLQKKKDTLMKKEKRTADEVKTVRQLNFAINAKQGDYKKKD
jgi:murein DD-endopeptidase MepM/ murein hydrolase activator NlpD